MKQPPTEQNLTIVCGDPIKDINDYPSAVYRGEVVYFCTRACLKAYKLDPNNFMAGEIEHPMDDES